MDPNLFHLDWMRLIEVLTAVVVLAVFLERGLAVIFESRFWVSRRGLSPLKEPIALMAALLIVWDLDFDALSMIALTERISWVGRAVTAAVIAGGSKASLKLFRDIMGIQSSAYQMREQLRAAREAPPPPAPPQ